MEENQSQAPLNQPQEVPSKAQQQKVTQAAEALSKAQQQVTSPPTRSYRTKPGFIKSRFKVLLLVAFIQGQEILIFGGISEGHTPVYQEPIHKSSKWG